MAVRVTAPNRAFMGRINGDQFFRGVCDNASEANLPYYVRQGYLIGDAVDLPSAVIPSAEPDTAQEEPVTVEDKPDTDVKDQAPETVDVPDAPKRNAPRKVWADFLVAHGVTVADGASRDDLIDAWEQSQA